MNWRRLGIQPGEDLPEAAGGAAGAASTASGGADADDAGPDGRFGSGDEAEMRAAYEAEVGTADGVDGNSGSAADALAPLVFEKVVVAADDARAGPGRPPSPVAVSLADPSNDAQAARLGAGAQFSLASPALMPASPPLIGTVPTLAATRSDAVTEPPRSDV